MAYLNREDILKADDVQTRDVDVPEWNGTVRVRGLSGYDRDAYQASMVAMGPSGQMGQDFTNITAKLVSRAVIDPETGEPMFNELDIGLLGQRSSVALTRVFQVASELSGITDNAVEAAAANLKPAPTDDSGSS